MDKVITEAFIGLDVSKDNYAVAIADNGRLGEVRDLGFIASTEVAVRRLVKKLSSRYEHLFFCYEAGPLDSHVKYNTLGFQGMPRQVFCSRGIYGVLN